MIQIIELTGTMHGNQEVASDITEPLCATESPVSEFYAPQFDPVY